MKMRINRHSTTANFASNVVFVYYSLLVAMALSMIGGRNDKMMMVSGIITRESPNAAIVSLSNARFFVSLFGRGDCAGTVIGRNYVVTAAHCVCGSSNVDVIDYREERHSVVAVYRNPDRIFDCDMDAPNGNDVAVLEFSGSPFRNHDIRRVYSDNDEFARVMWLLGMGKFGQPDDFPSSNACANGFSDGSLREGYNFVDNTNNGVLLYYMTRSGSASLSKEGIAQDGDSGGPALIEKNGEWFVAGVNSGSSENNSCDWGSEDEYCRLSEHADWIERATDTDLDNDTRGLWLTSDSGNGNGLIDNTVTQIVLCFSSENTVMVKQQTTKKENQIVRIGDIKMGDMVLTGNGNYQPVYSIDHQNSETFADFLQIKYSLLSLDDNNDVYEQQQPLLELSKRHMLFLEGQPDHPIPASHVQVGDKLLSLISSSGGKNIVGNSNNKNANSFVVTEISKIVRKGFYNPLTADGTIVVNGGIVASTYSALFLNNDQESNKKLSSSWIEIFDSRYQIMSHQSFFQTILKPYREFCTVMSSLNNNHRNHKNNDRVFVSLMAHQFYTRWLKQQTNNNLRNNDMFLVPIVSFARAINFVFGLLSPVCVNTFMVVVLMTCFAVLKRRRRYGSKL